MQAEAEFAAYFRPRELTGVEALHARFVAHAYPPHSHPMWTIAVVEGGAARFALEATQQRAERGELFVLEPEAVHTGMAAVPEGWAYKVLYVEPRLVHEWGERDGSVPRAARWVVFRDPALRARLLRVHDALAAEPPGLGVDEAAVAAVDALRPHLRPQPAAPARARPEHAAVRRARRYLDDRWDQRVPLADLARVAGLSRSELIRSFRGATGLTPHGYQINLRLVRARALLAAGMAPARIAAECGFADQPHLTRTFRRAVGVTPGRYARAVVG